jgi:hypothetical protein
LGIDFLVFTKWKEKSLGNSQRHHAKQDGVLSGDSKPLAIFKKAYGWSSLLTEQVWTRVRLSQPAASLTRTGKK